MGMEMAKAYALELRNRILSYVESGGKVTAASRIFDVAAQTIRNWLKRIQEEGSATARKTGTKGKRKIDYDKLKAYVAEHPDKTLHEMAKVFGVWPSAIEKALNKMKITRKKSLSP